MLMNNPEFLQNFLNRRTLKKYKTDIKTDKKNMK